MTGVSSQAGLASFRGAPLPPFVPLPLLWRREAETLHDQLAARDVLDPDTGERFTVRRIDDAIQSAVETVNGREGVRIVDIFDHTWSMLSDDVARFLRIEYNEMVEVAP